MAFMPGRLDHTNEVLVLLGDNLFAVISAKQADDIFSLYSITLCFCLYILHWFVIDIQFGKMAFMPGKLVHTNKILILLGDNWFVAATCTCTDIVPIYCIKFGLLFLFRYHLARWHSC